MILKPTTKFWDVRFTEPTVRDFGSGPYACNKNVHAMVAAESVEKVSELVRNQYPQATIHQINHRGGDCAILVQPDLVILVEEN